MPPRIAYEMPEFPWTGPRLDFLRIIFLPRYTLDRKDIVSEDQTAQVVVRTHLYEAGGISYHQIEWLPGMEWLDVNSWPISTQLHSLGYSPSSVIRHRSLNITPLGRSFAPAWFADQGGVPKKSTATTRVIERICGMWWPLECPLGMLMAGRTRGESKTFEGLS